MFNFCRTQCTTGAIRLAGGVHLNGGRIEVCVNGQWGTVCDDGWNVNNSKVVCKQLGYGASKC